MKTSVLIFIPGLFALLFSGCGLQKHGPKDQPAVADNSDRGASSDDAQPLSVIITYKKPVESGAVTPGKAFIGEKTDKTATFLRKRSEQQSLRPAIAPVSDDTTEISQSAVDEALEAEHVARSAYRFSFVPLFGILFPLAFIIGMVGTGILLIKLRRYRYTTRDGEQYERNAKIMLLISGIILVLLISLILLIAMGFL